MGYPILLLNYVTWHYSVALLDLVKNLRNILGFIVDFFSLPNLVRTLFAPWKRLGDQYTERFDPVAFLQTMTTNVIMRVVGFIVRTIVLALGLAALVTATFCALGIFILWLFLPVVIWILFIYGIIFLVL